MIVAIETRATSEIGSRRERLRDLMRADVLLAARRLLHEQGVKGLSMRALGQAVGVTAPTLYDYFASKDAVLDALYLEGVERLRDAFETTAASAETGVDQLSAVGDAYRAFALANPDIYFLIFGRVDAGYVPGEEQHLASYGLFLLLRSTVERAMAAGHVRQDDPDMVAHAIWTLAHGHVTLEIGKYLNECDSGVMEQLYHQNFRLLFRALLTDAGAAALSGLRPATEPWTPRKHTSIGA